MREIYFLDRKQAADRLCNTTKYIQPGHSDLKITKVSFLLVTTLRAKWATFMARLPKYIWTFDPKIDRCNFGYFGVKENSKLTVLEIVKH